MNNDAANFSIKKGAKYDLNHKMTLLSEINLRSRLDFFD